MNTILSASMVGNEALLLFERMTGKELKEGDLFVKVDSTQYYGNMIVFDCWLTRSKKYLRITCPPDALQISLADFANKYIRPAIRTMEEFRRINWRKQKIKRMRAKAACYGPVHLAVQ